jgi:hypothetical protein
MKTTSITTRCRCCGAQVEEAMHVLLCDGCLDARLAELERTRGRPSRWSGTRGWYRAALAGGWNGALADATRLRTAA